MPAVEIIEKIKQKFSGGDTVSRMSSRADCAVTERTALQLLIIN
jgi:hypothetical protein